MKLLFKSLIRLMVATFICATLVPVSSILAGPKCGGKHAGNPNCPPVPPDPPPAAITYTAELTGPVFNFPEKDVTPNGHENTMYPDSEAITMERPSGMNAPPFSLACDCGLPDCTPLDASSRAACNAWDEVFAACENFFGDEPTVWAPPIVVSEFTVEVDDWTIQQPGGVRVAMSFFFNNGGESPPNGDPYLGVTLQLIGNCFDDCADGFIPVPGFPKSVPLSQSWIIGKTVKGARKPRVGCVSGGSADQVGFPASTLVIRAKEN